MSVYPVGYDFQEVYDLRLRLSTRMLSNGMLSDRTLSDAQGAHHVQLPWQEVAILSTLMRRHLYEVTHKELLHAMYGIAAPENAKTIMQANVTKLRQRLSAIGAHSTIHAVRGVGYVLVRPWP